MTFPVGADVLNANMLAGSVASLEDNTEVNESDDGLVEPVPKWPRRRRKWVVSYTLDNSNTVETLFEVLGREKGFLFVPSREREYIATAQAIGTGDGSTVAFQLVLKVSTTSYFVQRDILYPITGTVVIKVAGTPTVPSSINNTKGIVTMSSAPTLGQAITADFHYATPARFTSDSIDVSMLQSDQVEIRSLTVEEVF